MQRERSVSFFEERLKQREIEEVRGKYDGRANNRTVV